MSFRLDPSADTAALGEDEFAVRVPVIGALQGGAVGPLPGRAGGVQDQGASGGVGVVPGRGQGVNPYRRRPLGAALAVFLGRVIV